MKHEVVEKFILNEDEKKVLRDASMILNNMLDTEWDVPTVLVDEQDIDPKITMLLNIAIQVEDKLIWSTFNCLSNEQRSRLQKEIYRKETP